MSFDMKYDREGKPIKNEAVQEALSYAVAPEQTSLAEPQQEYQEVETQEQTTTEEPTYTEKRASDQPQTTLYEGKEQEYNFRRLREAKEKSDRDRDEAIKFAMDLRRKYESPVEKQEDVQDDDIAIEQDDVAEGKHVRQINNKYKKLNAEFKEYKKQSQEQQHKSQLTAIEAKLKSQYLDFDKVVSPSNIEQLQYLYPEIANTINSSTDIYATAVSAYTIIKKMGIYKEDTFTEEKLKAQQNSAKPRPMNSIAPQQGSSPMSQANAFANGLTESLKAQLVREMNEIRKNN